LNVESTFASASTTVIFASSDGCPMRNPPMASQLLVLAAVPAPLPIEQQQHEHGDAEEVRGPRQPVDEPHGAARCRRTRPSEREPNQTSCVFHSRATAVGMSVWPAEYTMAMP
jgi:hypothetical protein